MCAHEPLAAVAQRRDAGVPRGHDRLRSGRRVEMGAGEVEQMKRIAAVLIFAGFLYLAWGWLPSETRQSVAWWAHQTQQRMQNVGVR